jgi:2-aminoethylphosphonate dioxygenase
MLIFGSYFAHRSGPNNSDKGRAAIVSTTNAPMARSERCHASMPHTTLSPMEEIAMMPTMKIGENIYLGVPVSILADNIFKYYSRKHWPPTADRIPGQKYEEGARLFGWGSPMLSVDAQTYKSMGL